MKHRFKLQFNIMIMTTLICSNMQAYELINATNAVVTADPKYTYDLNFTTLLLKPSTDSAYSSQAFPFNPIYDVPAVSPSWDVYKIKAHYNFAFDLGARIAIHDKNSLVSANWEHYRAFQSARINVAQSNNMVGPSFSIGPDESEYKKSSGEISYQRDKLSITYGQLIEIGQNLKVNLCTGVSFSRLQQNLMQLFTSPDATISREINITNSLSATGPEIGYTMTYNIYKGLGLITQGSADLLVGTSRNHTQFLSISPGVTPSPNVQNFTVENDVQIVPVFSQKIGLNLEHQFRDHCDFAIEIGYKAQIYVNVFHTITLSSSVVTPPINTSVTSGVYARTWHENITSFALGGPYFTFDIAF